MQANTPCAKYLCVRRYPSQFAHLSMRTSQYSGTVMWENPTGSSTTVTHSAVLVMVGIT